LKKSYDCNQEAIQYASTTRVPDALEEILAAAQQLFQAGLEIPSRKASKSGDSSKTAVIGVGLV
jgi:threonine dehydrogenase-like Zn-dependent dehydrogenase